MFMSRKLLLLYFMFLFCTSCEKNDNGDGLHPVNTRSDSLKVKPGTDIYIEVDTVLNEYDVDIKIHKNE